MMKSSLIFPAMLVAGVSVLASAPSVAQIYAPWPASPPPAYRQAPSAPRGYYANPGDDQWSQDEVDPEPRQRPRVAARRPAAAPYDRDDPDDYDSGGSVGDPLDLTAPRSRAPVARKPGAGARYASLPPDADPAYSTPVDYDGDVDSSQYTRQVVVDPTGEPANTLTINTRTRKLYLSLGGGRAIQYGVGVGREGFLWKGVAQVGRKAFWPGWTPPPEMLLRRPDLPKHMEGGMDNPLGARALYLFKGNKDTLFRIHGTNEPDTIGHAVSSGCIRMMNADVMDLYQRVQKGARVNVI